MSTKASRLFPALERHLLALGERIRLARLRREFTVETVCARANISRATFYRVEAGDDAVSIGIYARVLKVLGLDGDLDQVAADDVLGRKLQDLQLPTKRKRTLKTVTTKTSLNQKSNDSALIGTNIQVAQSND